MCLKNLVPFVWCGPNSQLSDWYFSVALRGEGTLVSGLPLPAALWALRQLPLSTKPQKLPWREAWLNFEIFCMGFFPSVCRLSYGLSLSLYKLLLGFWGVTWSIACFSRVITTLLHRVPNEGAVNICFWQSKKEKGCWSQQLVSCGNNSGFVHLLDC